MTTKIPNQDLSHANIDPKDGKEHVNPVSYTHLTLPTTPYV